MKIIKIIIILLLITPFIFLSSCTTTEHKKIKKYELTPDSPMPDTNKPDWINEKVTVIGQSAVNPKFASNPAQAQLMARRGAIIDAKRRLLEEILGLRLDSKTRIKDMVTEEDEVNAETSGFVRGAKIIGEHFNGSIYTVKMELKLYNVYMYLKKKKIYYK